MKSLIGTLLLLTAGTLLIYTLVAPAMTWDALMTAVASRDHERLSTTVNFPALRNNLNEQFNSLLMQEITKSPTTKEVNILQLSLASTLADGMVDICVTPIGIEALSSGRYPPPIQVLLASFIAPNAVANVTPDTSIAKDKPPVSTAPISSDVSRNSSTRRTIDSLNRFSVWVQHDRSSAIRFVFARHWLSWRLVNITVPLTDEIQILQRMQTEYTRNRELEAEQSIARATAAIAALKAELEQDSAKRSSAPRSTVSRTPQSPEQVSSDSTPSRVDGHADRLQESTSSRTTASTATPDTLIMANYASQIRMSIVERVNTDGLPAGLSCVLAIRLHASGDVLDARIEKSSGNEEFDRRALLGTYQASPLPMPDDPALAAKFSQIRLTFAP